MKLVELFSIVEDRAIDFEVLKKDLPKFDDPTTSKTVGTFDGYEIKGERFNSKIDAYGIVLDDVVSGVAFVEAADRLVAGKTVQRLVKVWVDDKTRGKGIAASLILFLLRKLNIKLLVDDFVTIMGEKMLRKLATSKKIDLTGVEGGKLVQVEPDKLLMVPNRYHLILESQKTVQDEELFEDIRLPDYRQFRGDPEWD